ncbi:MAG: glucose-1-phosphate thymidylyltransferase RfbA [Verrucomicrobiota bacterium]
MKARKGIILAGGSGTRLYPITKVVSKQMLPVYDKPMIYYPLSILMLTGIREILIITTPHDQSKFQDLLQDGSDFGLQLTYAAQPKPEGLAQAFIIGESFLDGAPSSLVLGDNLIYGEKISQTLKKASAQETGATIFGYRVADPTSYGVVSFDSTGKATSLEEKPKNPKSNYAIPGIYFYDSKVCKYAKEQKPSARGELEITDLNRTYLESEELHVELLGRGTAWLDTGSPESLLQAANFVQAIQERQGWKIACLEEIAFRNHWVDATRISQRADSLGKTEYASYLRQILLESNR